MLEGMNWKNIRVFSLLVLVLFVSLFITNFHSAPYPILLNQAKLSLFRYGSCRNALGYIVLYLVHPRRNDYFCDFICYLKYL